MKIDFSEITSMVRRDEITDELVEVIEDTMVGIYTDLSAPPPLGTPVDTGVARQGWQIDLSDPLNPQISNPVPYIRSLNDGHSKQSPSGFVDNILDKHTR